MLLIDLPDTLNIARVPYSTSSVGTAPVGCRLLFSLLPFLSSVLALDRSSLSAFSSCVDGEDADLLDKLGGEERPLVEDEEVSATRRREAGEGRTLRGACYPSPESRTVSYEALQASLSVGSERKVGKR